MYRTTTAAIAFALAIATHLPQTQAAILYSTIGSQYSQSFDSLPNTPTNATLGNSPIGWTDDNSTPGVGNFSILGWYLRHPIALTEGGFNGRQRLRTGNGGGTNATTGSFYSFGDTGSTDRALGGLASTTLAANNANMFIGAKIRNNTGAIMTSFTLSYDGEQWRDGGSNSLPVASQQLDFDYSLNAMNIQGDLLVLNDSLATFVNVDSLDFVSPVFTNTTSGAAVNGNTDGKLSIGAVTVSGINWLPGTDLWIRWRDLSNPGNDHGLAIDNVKFSAIPEPSSIVLMFSAALALLGYRRFC